MSAPVPVPQVVAGRRLDEWFERGLSWSDYLESVQKHRALWWGVWERARIPADALAGRVLPRGGVRLLALSEDWCGDASNTLPVVARLAEELDWELRVLPRDDNLDLMDVYLTDGRSRSIPAVIGIDADGREIGWWAPRPAQLQAWVLGPGQELEKAERYKRTRAWYARDRGGSTVRELLDALGLVAAHE